MDHQVRAGHLEEDNDQVWVDLQWEVDGIMDVHQCPTHLACHGPPLDMVEEDHVWLRHLEDIVVRRSTAYHYILVRLMESVVDQTAVHQWKKDFPFVQDMGMVDTVCQALLPRRHLAMDRV